MADAVSIYADWINSAKIMKGARPERRNGERLSDALYAEDVLPSVYQDARARLLETARRNAGLRTVCGGDPFDLNFNDSMIRMHEAYLPREALEGRLSNGALGPAYLIAAAARMASVAMKVPLSQIAFDVLTPAASPRP